MPDVNLFPALLVPKEQAIHRLGNCQIDKGGRMMLNIIFILATANPPRPMSPAEITQRIGSDNELKVTRLLKTGVEDDWFVTFKDGTYMVSNMAFSILRKADKVYKEVITALERRKNKYLRVEDSNDG